MIVMVPGPLDPWWQEFCLRGSFNVIFSKPSTYMLICQTMCVLTANLHVINCVLHGVLLWSSPRSDITDIVYCLLKWFIYLCVSLPVCLSICVYVCVSVRVSICLSDLTTCGSPWYGTLAHFFIGRLISGIHQLTLLLRPDQYNRPGWLGVKKQVIYLLSQLWFFSRSLDVPSSDFSPGP